MNRKNTNTFRSIKIYFCILKNTDVSFSPLKVHACPHGNNESVKASFVKAGLQAIVFGGSQRNVGTLDRCLSLCRAIANWTNDVESAAAD